MRIQDAILASICSYIYSHIEKTNHKISHIEMKTRQMAPVLFSARIFSEVRQKSIHQFVQT